MKKRILAGALACAMTFSLSAVASADPITEATDGAYTSGAIEGESSLKAFTVNVSVPTDSFAVLVNPYQLSVDIGEGETATTSNAQIIADSMELVSTSDVDLNVGIKIGAEPAEDSKAVVATAPITPTTKTKSIFTYLEVTGGKQAFTEKDSYNATANKAQQFAFPAIKRGGTTDKPTVTGYLEKADVVKLMADVDGEGKAESKAEFAIKGSVATNPTEVWETTDKLKYSITYNFVPAVAEPAPTATPGA